MSPKINLYLGKQLKMSKFHLTLIDLWKKLNKCWKNHKELSKKQLKSMLVKLPSAAFERNVRKDSIIYVFLKFRD